MVVGISSTLIGTPGWGRSGEGESIRSKQFHCDTAQLRNREAVSGPVLQRGPSRARQFGSIPGRRLCCGPLWSGQ